VAVVAVVPPQIALVTAGVPALDTVSVLAPAYVQQAGSMNPTVGYQLFTGNTPVCSSTPVATAPAPVAPAGYPVSFPPQPTAAVPPGASGARKYYLVRAYDSASPPNLGPASPSVSSVSSIVTSAGATYQQLFTAPYGPGNSGLGATLGYAVYDQFGAVLVAYTLGLTENTGTGVYTALVALDTAWSGYAQLDAPGGAPPTVVPFGPVHFDGTAVIPATDPAGDGSSTLYGYLRDIRAVTVGRAQPNPNAGTDYYDPSGTQKVKTLTFNDTIPPTERNES
jgi:hypothetical protein